MPNMCVQEAKSAFSHIECSKLILVKLVWRSDYRNRVVLGRNVTMYIVFVLIVFGVESRLKPKPVVARTVEDILASKGVKPSLSPNLNVLATIEALDVKNLLFIGVGCQVSSTILEL